MVGVRRNKMLRSCTDKEGFQCYFGGCGVLSMERVEILDVKQS